MRRSLGLRRVGVGAFLACLMLCPLAPTSLADTGGHGPTFAALTEQFPVVVPVGIRSRAAGGLTLDVERVLKGRAPTHLDFPSTAQAAVQPGWSRAVVAFSDPSEIDFRGPTIAWHVAPDGRLDPEGYQQYEGIPSTLPGLLRWFSRAPDTDAVSTTVGDAAGPRAGTTAWLASLLLLGACGSVGAALVWRRVGRSRPVRKVR